MNRKYILPFLLILQIVSLKILAYFPEFVEKYYSNGIYLYISKFSRTVLGKVPFSVGDILYGILIIWLVYRIIKNWKKTKTKEKIISTLSLISVFYFWFHLLWAFNYYRIPLTEKLELKTEYSDQQLLDFTRKLIVKTNEIHLLITKDSLKKVVVPYLHEQVFERSLQGYQRLQQVHPEFKFEIPSSKTSLLSHGLSYMGFGGYLNPFTNEAQVNYQIPMYSFPATACHEMAHQIGHGSESECNFIGFLASTHNSDLCFKYSGYTHALKYCLGIISYKNEIESKKMLRLLHPGILQNFEESKQFWKQHQSFVDQFFEAFYDNFLKINQQKDGMISYSKFVDLLVNYYEKREL